MICQTALFIIVSGGCLGFGRIWRTMSGTLKLTENPIDQLVDTHTIHSYRPLLRHHGRNKQEGDMPMELMLNK
ncbi:MAG: hypothetical protein ACI9W1_000661 [Candidatus Azotimanducaceae bacterium]|jgi:hypothetical protein